MTDVTLNAPLPASFRDRMDRMRSRIQPGAKILEVGASYNPTVRKSDGFNVFTVDHATRDELLAKYDQHFDKPDIEDVDFICHDGNLTAAIPKEHHGTFDVCLASHVIEHMTNPIMFLQAIEALLKPDGVFTLAIPDKRGCFDFFRPLTTTGQWVLAYVRKASIHTGLAQFDFQAYTVGRPEGITWSHANALGEFGFASADGLALGYSLLQQIGDASDGEYRDTHSWVFVPSSFALIIYELHRLGLTNLAPENLHGTPGVDFFVDLQQTDAPPISDPSRLRLLKQAAIEQMEAFKRVEEADAHSVRSELVRHPTLL